MIPHLSSITLKSIQIKALTDLHLELANLVNESGVSRLILDENSGTEEMAE